MKNMIFECSTINKDIIKKYNNELMKEGAKDGVHCGLKRGRGVAKPERHHRKFKVPMVCAKICFAYILFGHQDLVVSL